MARHTTTFEGFRCGPQAENCFFVAPCESLQDKDTLRLGVVGESAPDYSIGFTSMAARSGRLGKDPAELSTFLKVRREAILAPSRAGDVNVDFSAPSGNHGGC